MELKCLRCDREFTYNGKNIYRIQCPDCAYWNVDKKKISELNKKLKEKEQNEK